MSIIWDNSFVMFLKRVFAGVLDFIGKSKEPVLGAEKR